MIAAGNRKLGLTHGGPGGASGVPRRTAAAALLVGFVSAVLSGALGCSGQLASGPPLVVIEAVPGHGSALAAGSAMRVLFNLPVDPDGLAGHITISPPCQHTVSCFGQEVMVHPDGAAPGRSYTLSFAAGIRGMAGGLLQQGFDIAFSAVPAEAGTDASASAPASGSVTAPPPRPGSSGAAAATDPLAVTGARLYLDGCGIFACDQRGVYNSPRFDRARLFLGGTGTLDATTRAALLEVRPDGGLRAVAAQTTGGPGWIELALEEEIRAGWTYEFCLVSAKPNEPQTTTTETLYAWSVQGSPRIYVWSLEVTSGRASPVGRLDVGMQVDELVGSPGGVFAAVGSPGGVLWNGLRLVQPLSKDLSLSGPSVAVFAYSNYLPRQLGPGGGSIVAVGPARDIPSLVGDAAWEGFSPSDGSPEANLEPGTASRSQAPSLDRGADAEEPVLLEIAASGARPLVYGRDLAGRFVSGPALSPDGGTVAFLTHDFAESALVRVWSYTVPATGMIQRELARLVFPNEVVGDFGYGGGVSWRADGDGLWWDVCLPDDTAEVWTVDASGGARSLVTSGSALHLKSPDGRMLFCRGREEGIIVATDGRQLRAFRGSFSAAVWLPDSTGLLLSDGHGVLYASVGGGTRRLVSFPAGPGCFVSPTDYWFISDRRF